MNIVKTDLKPKNLKSVNTLMGIAILMVLLVHSAQIQTINSGLASLARYGQMGVQLFFLLSGFKLCMSWLKNNKPDFFKFYKKRLLSVAPGYYIMIVVFTIVTYVVINILQVTPFSQQNSDAFCVLINIAFLNGVVPACNNIVVPGGWYVGTIMILYLIFPTLIQLFKLIYAKNKHIAHMLPYFALAFSFILQSALAIKYQTAVYSSNNSFIYFSFINQLPCFLLGVSLYYKYQEGNIQNVSKFISLANFLVLTIFSFILFNSNIPLVFSVIPMISALSFCWLFVFFENTSESTKITKLLSKWGELSYAAFLIHTLFFWYFQEAVVKFVKQIWVVYDSTLLYIVMIIPMYILTYYTARYFHQFLGIVSRHICRNS